MVVSIVGGHGQIALELTRLLSADGVEVRSLIRNPDHKADVEAVGGEALVVDFETADDGAIDRAVAGSDVVVFAAGAGPGSGAERKETVDYGAAARLIEAARRNGSPRYLMISAISADPDAPGDEVYDVYRRAKGRADADLVASGLDHLVVRPVRLTDEPAGGSVALSSEAEALESEYIPRADVAAILAEAMKHPEVSGITYASAGEIPIPQAFG